MRARRLMITAGFFVAALSAPFVRAHAAGGAPCISTAAGEVCLAQCIGTQQQACGSDAACHRAVSGVIQSLARAKAGTAECDDLVAMVEGACGCVASPSGAFLE